MYRFILILFLTLFHSISYSFEISFDVPSFSFKTDFSALEYYIDNQSELNSRQKGLYRVHTSMRAMYYYKIESNDEIEVIENISFNQLYYQSIDCQGGINCSSFQQGFTSHLNHYFTKPIIDAKNVSKASNEAVMCMVGALKNCQNKISKNEIDFIPVMLVVMAEKYSQEGIGGYAAILIGNETKKVVDVFLLEKSTRRSAKKLGTELATKVLKIFENNR